ncbi:MAG TPA: DEAD/DEAH box helicase [Natronosporangium sp.]|nr:DEAD/DEAH box helicase [Natronosporangium sp.]
MTRTETTSESRHAPAGAAPNGSRFRPVRPDSPTFAALGVRPETVEALAAVGITQTFAIQEYALPIALRGSDVIGQAPTGTGKTLAFGVPLLERVTAPGEGAAGVPQALVVVPTRELGLQVADDLATAGATRQVRVVAIYGGVAYEPQVDALRRGVEVVVGTPGRLLDLAHQGHLRLDAVRTLVLDEADRMLDLGFLDDVERILAMLPAERQTMLFSATMPAPIVALARRFMRTPVTVHASDPDAPEQAPQTRQLVYRAHALNKIEMVSRILQARDRGLTMIFARTKRGVDKIASELEFRGFAVAAVHGDLGQSARERALRAFRNGKVDVLVATDVAARGLDVLGVTHVINYDCPEDPDAYTHRIGRTGRAGATGVAVTFVDWEDLARWGLIDKTLGLGVPEPPETYHTSPWLYTDLDIPTDVTGELPHAQRSRAGLAAEQEEDLGGRSGGRRGDRRARRDRPRSRGGGTGSPRGSDGDESTPGSRRRRRRARAGSPRPAGDVAAGASPGPDGSDRPAGPDGPAAADSAVTGDTSAAQPAADAGTRSRSSRRRRRRRSGGAAATAAAA